MKSLHHNHHHTPPFSTDKLLPFSRPPPPCGLLTRHNFHLPPNHVRNKPMVMGITSSHMVVLAVNSPATTGDLSVLIPTSVGFIFLYWIANFVIPELIVKDLNSQDPSQDQNPNEDQTIKSIKTINSVPKPKGFNTNK